MLTRFAFLTCLAATLSAQQAPALKEVFKDHFVIGAALNTTQFNDRDEVSAAIIKRHFNTITSENILKWQLIHPKPGVYAFDEPDRYVAFGEKHGMTVIGHTLVWHSQTPRWVFEHEDGTPLTREALLERMQDHIRNVAGRYKGRIKGWDVVNEALNEDGTLRQSPWMKIIGEDYILKAFQWAHEADPKAELYYNDYSLQNEAKRKGAIALIRKLRAAGVKVHAVGMQDHHRLQRPSLEDVDKAIQDFTDAGIKVCVTELDVDVLPAATREQTADVNLTVEAREKLNPYRDGLPDAVQQELAQRYAGLFAVYAKHRDAIERITFWGVTDRVSWLNNWPVRGRTNYPLLFDRTGQPKPAFHAVVKAAKP